MTTILQVSDSHLSPRAPEASANWQRVVAFAAAHEPDLIVHTGDISLDGANDAADLRFAREHLDRLPCPWRALPGNHDIGDVGPTHHPVTDGARAAYQEVFGEADWSVNLDGWQLIGVDSQLLASDLDGAHAQWAWLEGELAVQRPVMLFLHRPLLVETWEETDAEPARYLPTIARDRLRRLVDAADVRAVATGHVHQFNEVDDGRRAHVWAPSTWAVLSDSYQPIIGTKTTGVVMHTIDGDSIRSELVRPEGMITPTIDEDLPNPYTH